MSYSTGNELGEEKGLMQIREDLIFALLSGQSTAPHKSLSRQTIQVHRAARSAGGNCKRAPWVVVLGGFSPVYEEKSRSLCGS